MGMINQAADDVHIGASYVIDIISIFNDGGIWVPEPHLLGERPICCIVHQPEQITCKNGWPRGNDDEDDIHFPASSIKSVMNLLYIKRASGNLEALYRKGVFYYFNHSDPNALGMINQATDGGHIGASYTLAIISIFKDGESMREGLMFIANMRKTEPLKLR
ncbi:hypothetical protein H5410_001812 [Solanum commersonii]|uniref:At2g35280-like TPR domain-containing protein n=1 Tax=Solanum commersonii TaxID=4109 RepID=A0A9J6B151_SOLCO|nr:hypothetical protein H5410_001812 [Solanum commersonii]